MNETERRMYLLVRRAYWTGAVVGMVCGCIITLIWTR